VQFDTSFHLGSFHRKSSLKLLKLYAPLEEGDEIGTPAANAAYADRSKIRDDRFQLIALVSASARVSAKNQRVEEYGQTVDD